MSQALPEQGEQLWKSRSQAGEQGSRKPAEQGTGAATPKPAWTLAQKDSSLCLTICSWNSLSPVLTGLLFTGRVGDSRTLASCHLIISPVQRLQEPQPPGLPSPWAPLLLGHPFLGTPAPQPPCTQIPCQECPQVIQPCQGLLFPHKQSPEAALFHRVLALPSVLCLVSRRSLMMYLLKTSGFHTCVFLPR